jgi:hypothetical protein
MKPVKDMHPGELADMLETYPIPYENKDRHNPLFGIETQISVLLLQELVERLREIHAEYERRWNNLSAAQKLDALAYPPDPNSLEQSFLRHLENAENRINELEKANEALRDILEDRRRNKSTGF